MPSPFPGMNPYLENPALWSEVHSLLIAAIPSSMIAKGIANTSNLILQGLR